jgi:hypothetical protein
MSRLGFVLLFLISACSSPSLADFRCQGEAETRRLTVLLKQVETKEGLQKTLPQVKKSLNRIADLLIEVRQTRGEGEARSEPSLASDELFIEMARLYEIPGARDLFEQASSEAIHKLDRFYASQKCLRE